MLVAEAEVLQFGFDGEEPEAVSQRCVEEGGFACDLKLLVGLHRAERAHVVQAVGDLDEDYTGIITDGQQELTDILRLQAIDVLRYLLGRDLRKTFDDLCDLITEATADILYGVLGILYDIV